MASPKFIKCSGGVLVPDPAPKADAFLFEGAVCMIWDEVPAPQKYCQLFWPADQPRPDEGARWLAGGECIICRYLKLNTED